jgi:uncharacterized iron-regulated membrane protein
VRFLNWIKDLHTDLTLGKSGRAVNGVGAISIVLLAATGAVLWWPGIHSWRRHLKVRTRVGFRRFNWELHSAVGFWVCPFVLMWGITGIVLILDTMPVHALQPAGLSVPSRLAAVSYLLHFGRFASPIGRLFWGVVGVAPALLFITGLLMWWKRPSNLYLQKFR